MGQIKALDRLPIISKLWVKYNNKMKKLFLKKYMNNPSFEFFFSNFDFHDKFLSCNK